MIQTNDRSLSTLAEETKKWKEALYIKADDKKITTFSNFQILYTFNHLKSTEDKVIICKGQTNAHN